MEKYELLPKQLLYEGSCTNENFFSPGMPSEADILAVHTLEYMAHLNTLTLDKRAARKIGFPLSASLVEREYRITQGTIECCNFALAHGISMNIAGGTHHAYTDRGEGFCILNDQAVAARFLQRNKHAKKILIIDLDVHQGNGTAEIFANDNSIFTFSMHGAGNYPFKKEQSDLDIALPDGTEDAVYLEELKKTLPKLIERVQPDFAFYLSGVDILETDKLGRLSCTVTGCRDRDRFVFETLLSHNIPVQVSMGGGYSPDIKIIIEAHANTFRLAQELYFS